MTTPKISIITIVYNDAKGLEKTIKSITNQTYKNIELIVIDGGSTDGTVKVIKKHQDQIDFWVSEKDDGIFHAMNKGIRVSNGIWVNFMNAGDTFFCNSTLARISFYKANSKVLLYGKKINKGTLIEPTDPRMMKYGGTFANHQSMFFNASILNTEDFLYDLNYPIYADYELVARLYINYPAGFQFLDQIIADYEGEGISSRVSAQKRKDKYMILYQLYGIYGVLRGILHRLWLEIDKRLP